MRLNMFSHVLVKISLFLFSSGQVFYRFIDSDLNAENSKALSLILVFKIILNFVKMVDAPRFQM
jgi:hypothetical protein